MKEQKIVKLHEASVQRFCWGSSQLSYLFFGKLKSLQFEKQHFKKILRQRFYFFNPPLPQWLSYKKTGYPIFIEMSLKPVQIGLFQSPALFFYKNNFA